MIGELVRREDDLEDVLDRHVGDEKIDCAADIRSDREIQFALDGEELQDVGDRHPAQVDGDLLPEAGEVFKQELLLGDAFFDDGFLVRRLAELFGVDNLEFRRHTDRFKLDGCRPAPRDPLRGDLHRFLRERVAGCQNGRDRHDHDSVFHCSPFFLAPNAGLQHFHVFVVGSDHDFVFQDLLDGDLGPLDHLALFEKVHFLGLVVLNDDLRGAAPRDPHEL